MNKLLLILILISGKSFGQNPMYKLIAKNGGCSKLLDQYSGAAAAYSLRLLDCQYAGSAIRVRRSSDNTEQDIGFTAGGDLDTASLKTFVGTGGADDGFVVTWYDQSGNGRGATQATGSSQPFIMDNGVVLRAAGKVSTYWDGGSRMLMASFTGTAITSHSMFAVFSASGGDAFGRIASMRASGTNDYDVYCPIISNGSTYTDFGAYASAGYRAGRTTSTSNLNLYSAIHTGSEIQNSVNAGSNATYSHSLSTTIIRYTIGASALSSDITTDGDITGYILEVICYQSDQNSNKSGILSNINTYYTIY